MSPSEFQQWRQDLLQHAATIAANTRVHLAALPQFYTIDDLRIRYAMGRDQVIAAIEKHLGIIGQVGVPTRVPLDRVLRLDQVLREEAEAVRHA